MLTPTLILASSVLGATGLITLAAGDTLPGYLQYVQSGGVIGMFIVLFYALLTRKIVMGWTYDAMVVERDYYRNIAYKTTDTAERQVTAVEEMLKRNEALNMRQEVMDAREDRQRREAETFRRERNNE